MSAEIATLVIVSVLLAERVLSSLFSRTTDMLFEISSVLHTIKFYITNEIRKTNLPVPYNAVCNAV